MFDLHHEINAYDLHGGDTLKVSIIHLYMLNGNLWNCSVFSSVYAIRYQCVYKFVFFLSKDKRIKIIRYAKTIQIPSVFFNLFESFYRLLCAYSISKSVSFKPLNRFESIGTCSHCYDKTWLSYRGECYSSSD